MDTPPEAVGQDPVPPPRAPREEAPSDDLPGADPGRYGAAPGVSAWPPPPAWPPGTPPAPGARTPYVPLPATPPLASAPPQPTVPAPPPRPSGSVYGSPQPPGPAPVPGPAYGSPAAPGTGYGPPAGSGSVYGSPAGSGSVYGSPATPGAGYGSPATPGPVYGSPAAPVSGYGPGPAAGSVYGSPAPAGGAPAGTGSPAAGTPPAGMPTIGPAPAGTSPTRPFPAGEAPGGGQFPTAPRPTSPLPPYPAAGPFPPLYPQPGQSTYPPPGGSAYPSMLPSQAQSSPYAYTAPGSAPPAYGPPAYPAFDPYAAYRYPPPRKRRRRWPAVVAVLAVLVLGGFGAYAAKSLTGNGKTPAGPQAGPTASGIATHAGPETIEDVLAAQSRAIVAGDQKGFLARVDPKATAALNTYKLIYANLRAMHVTEWAQRISVGGGPVSDRDSFDVEIEYCLLVASCDGDQARLHITTAKKAGKILIESATLPKPDEFNKRPYPWEATKLQALTGDRVVVAASSAYAYKLDTVLPIAEDAAKVADTFAHWDKPPVYVVYLAGPTDKTKWFGGELKNTLGEALPLTPTDIQVMLVMPLAGEVRYAGPGTLHSVLQHEMTHVATLYNDTSGYGHDTLIEGIAEYAAYNGHSDWARYRLEDTKAYLRSGKWPEKCYMTSEITSRSVITASGAYGIGFLTIKRLVSRFGMSKMLDFWGEVERDGHSVDTAAKDVFGLSWSSVNADCVSFVHTFVGA